MFATALGISTTTIMYIVIGVVLVLMIVLSIIPQKKRQKQQQEMMNSITVGTKVMTIGRMVGKITQVNADNTLVINVGSEDNPTLIVIDRQAVGLVLEGVPAPAVTAPAEEPAAEEATEEPAFETVEEVVEEVVEVVEETTEE